jgi:hypothetical protein
MTSNSESERRSQAVLILAHRDLDWVLTLVRRLAHPDIGFYIHVDAKTDPVAVRQFRNACRPLSGINYISTHYRVNWAGLNSVLASLQLARQALADRPTDLHLITGQDYPVKSADHIAAHGKSGKIHLEHHSLPSELWAGDGGLHRLQRYHPYDLVNARTRHGKLLVGATRRAQRILPYHRSLPDMQLFGGSAYWSLPRDAMTYLVEYVDEHAGLLNRFKHTYSPDEMLPHTVLLNSHLADRVVNDDLRFIVWRGTGSSPAILNEGDTADILASDDLFARKICHPESTSLIAHLDRAIPG